MQRFKKIFFATDFSECGEHAQRYAFAMAKRFDSQLHVGHVVDTAYPSYAGIYGIGGEVDLHIDEIKKHAQESLVKVVDLAREQGIDAHPHLLGGRPPEEIVEAAQNSGCDLIVIGTRGRSGFEHFLFGSTCERVVRYASIPVLAVKPEEKEFVHGGDVIEIRRVLCPCDLSKISEEAFPIAADVCRTFGAALIALHVIDSRVEYPLLLPEAQVPTSAELHEHAVTRLEKLMSEFPDIDTKIEVVTGTPSHEIKESVKRHDADLVVITTHGRRGFPLALIGSTAEKIVRTVPTPVLSARPIQSEKNESEIPEALGDEPEPAPA